MTMKRKLFQVLAFVGTLTAGALPSVPKSLPALELPMPASSSAPRSHDITVQDLLRLRLIGGLSISPDGKWVALTLRQPDLKLNQYRTALFVTATSRSKKAPESWQCWARGIQ